MNRKVCYPVARYSSGILEEFNDAVRMTYFGLGFFVRSSRGRQSRQLAFKKFKPSFKTIYFFIERCGRLPCLVENHAPVDAAGSIKLGLCWCIVSSDKLASPGRSEPWITAARSLWK